MGLLGEYYRNLIYILFLHITYHVRSMDLGFIYVTGTYLQLSQKISEALHKLFIGNLGTYTYMLFPCRKRF